MKIDVLHPRTARRAFTCEGPRPSGACARVVGDEEALPCAGMLLQPDHAVSHLGVLRFSAARRAPGCPLRSLS